ncbi:MAG: L,D-transpeptidase [bacterium]|nr:L,D-transpeptidase [bacterium]
MRYYIVFLLAIIAVLCFIFPMKAAIPSANLEDVVGYFIALKIEAKKKVVQETLPGKEEVVQIYDEPTYFQVVDTCDWRFAGECVPVRTGPGESYPNAGLFYQHQGVFLTYVRMGQVFAMSALVKADDGSLWYKIALDKKKMLFPSRIRTDWFVPASHFTRIDFTPINPQSDSIKKIVIVLSTQALYAYEGERLFMKTSISSGQSRWNLATSTGTFNVFRKTPMTIMDGPLSGMASLVTPENLADFEYTLFVPYAMAFDADPLGTSFIHEAYWHNSFGTERSHGCVNVSYEDALTLYNWTPNPSLIKIPVTVLP